MEELETGYYWFKLPWWAVAEVGHVWVDEDNPEDITLSRCGLPHGFNANWIKEHRVVFLGKVKKI